MSDKMATDEVRKYARRYLEDSEAKPDFRFVDAEFMRGVLALIAERDQLRAQSEYRVKAWSREVDEVNAALAAAEERMAAMEAALRKIGSMLSVAHDFNCFDDKCEGNCGDPEKMCDSCRMADACIDAGYTITAALDGTTPSQEGEDHE